MESLNIILNGVFSCKTCIHYFRPCYLLFFDAPQHCIELFSCAWRAFLYQLLNVPILNVIFSNPNFREKPKLVKPSESSQGGPGAKKTKVDPNETTMVKKVGEPHSCGLGLRT